MTLQDSSHTIWPHAKLTCTHGERGWRPLVHLGVLTTVYIINLTSSADEERKCIHFWWKLPIGGYVLELLIHTASRVCDDGHWWNFSFILAEVSSGKTGALAEPDLWPLVEGANTKENVVYGSQSSVQWRFLTGSLYTYITLFPSWTKAYLLPCQSVYTVHAISLYDSGVQNCHMCIGDVCVACWRHVCVFLLWVCCQGACGSLQEISPTLRHSL